MGRGSAERGFLAVMTSLREHAPYEGPLPPAQKGEKGKHKKCLVQSPKSYFMDVKCPGCYKITAFSHAQTIVLRVGCTTVLC